MEWKLIYDDELELGNYVGIYADGSGAMLFSVREKEIIDAENGQISMESLEESILYFAKLPTDFKLWFEPTIGEQPEDCKKYWEMFLSKPDKNAK